MDLLNNLMPLLSVAPQSSGAATLTGSGVDVSNYKDVAGIVAAGDIEAATTVDAKLQESDDDSTYSDVSGETITQLGATDDDKIRWEIKYRRHAGSAKKYARLVITVGGTGNALVCGILLGGNPAQAPVS